MNLKIFTDGAARGNPGPAAIGVVIQDDTGKIIHQFGKRIGPTTNNIAEYMGVVEALKYLILNPTIYKSKVRRIDFFLDSKLVVNQLNGFYKIKNHSLREMVLKIRSLEQELDKPIYYHYGAREMNTGHTLAENALSK